MQKEKAYGRDVYLVKCNCCGKEMMLFFESDSNVGNMHEEVLKGNAQCLGNMAIGSAEKMVKDIEPIFICQNCLKADPMSKVCGTARKEIERLKKEK